MTRSAWLLCAAMVLCVGLPLMAAEQGDVIDVVIVAESDVEAVAEAVVAAGGVVTHQYTQVPALAARMPISRMAALRSVAGVGSVEKDGLVSIIPGRTRLPEGAAEVSLASLNGTVKALDYRELEAEPDTYLNYYLTGAAATWAETGAGAGSVVAVVDTGTGPVFPCLASGQVIGAPGYPTGFDAVGDNPANALDNDPHGTWVGNTIASSCALSLLATDEIAQAFLAHAPWALIPTVGNSYILPLFGIAPAASLYPVKVFAQSGGSTPTSEILEGLDHVLQLKKDGLLDIDVVNMSLGGGTVWDGRDAYDRFVDEVGRAGMLVVTSAGNSGPVPNTVGSPGTARRAVTVGATDEAVVSRVFYEWYGLVLGAGPGQGLIMRPTDETRIVNFSSRGPLSDGRGGPHIAALGTWNFAQRNDGNFSWLTGTSFASPTVAGAAALLNAWWENTKGRDTHTGKLRNALLLSADPRRVGWSWRDVNDQGYGVLDIPDALELLKHPRCLPGGFAPIHAERLEPNVLGCVNQGGIDRFRSRQLELAPGKVKEFVFEIDETTSAVRIDIEGLQIPPNSSPAIWDNAIQVDVQSAKRSAASRPVDTLLFGTSWDGASLSIDIEDGPWTLLGSIPWAYQPMEPGLMKLTLAGDFVNELPVGARARIVRENLKDRLRKPLARMPMEDASWDYILFFDMPPGVSTATFDLAWRRDWSRFPTSDVDLILFSPTSVFLDGATLNAPERQVVVAPEAGLWMGLVDAFEVYKRDVARLYVTLEE